MKYSLIFILISCFCCELHIISQYQTTQQIRDGNGLVILELDKFDIGDSIYIKYCSYRGKLLDVINYDFSDIFPTSQNQSLNNSLKAFKEELQSNTKNVTDQYGRRKKVVTTSDHFYFYEFEKKNSVKYLIMNYSFIPGEISYLEVKNIKKNVVLQVFTIVCMILSFVLILVTIFLCRKYNPKCRRRRKVTSYDITSDIKKEDLSIPTISDNPPQYPPVYNNNQGYYSNNLPPTNYYPQYMNQPAEMYNYQNNIPPTSDSTDKKI